MELIPQKGDLWMGDLCYSVSRSLGWEVSPTSLFLWRRANVPELSVKMFRYCGKLHSKFRGLEGGCLR